MIRSILVPLDGSRFSEQAIPPAGSIARSRSASLELVLVHDPLTSTVKLGARPVPTTPLAGAMALEPGVEAHAPERLGGYLRAMAETVQAESGVVATVRVLEGPVVETLASHVSQTRADLVVMTTHGRSGLSRVMLGSVADDMVRRVSVPLLLIKPGGTPPPMAAHRYQRVLIPTDGSPLSESAIEPAIEIAGDVGVEYTVVRVIEPMTSLAIASFGDIGDVAREERARQEYQTLADVEPVAQRLRARGLVARAQVLVHVDPARAILHYASESGADLIAMATHGRGGLGRFILGSVATKVMQGSERAVLLYKPVSQVHDRS
jgi:nucleotide-binding universal stress UspA family protein